MTRKITEDQLTQLLTAQAVAEEAHGTCQEKVAELRACEAERDKQVAKFLQVKRRLLKEAHAPVTHDIDLDTGEISPSKAAPPAPAR